MYHKTIIVTLSDLTVINFVAKQFVVEPGRAGQTDGHAGRTDTLFFIRPAT